jgi:translocation and assembly module TamB
VRTGDSGAVTRRPVSRKTIMRGLGLAAFLAIGLGALVSVAYFSMVRIRESLLSSFRKDTGYEISYKTISPSFFQFIEIRGLAITSLDASPHTVLTIDKIRIHYSLWSLIFDSDKLRAVQKIEAEDGNLVIDEQKDRRLISFFSGLFSSSGQEHRLSPDFALSAKDLNLAYRSGSGEWALRHLFTAVASADGFLKFTLHSQGEARTTAASRAADLATSLDMNGRINSDFSALDADFRVESLQAGEVTLKEQQFHISLKDKTLDITKVQDRSPLDVSVQYSLDRSFLAINFMAENLQPGNLIAFTDKLRDINPVLAASISAQGSLTYDLPRNDLDFALALDGSLTDSIAPVAVRLHTRITGTEERIDFNPVAISSTLGRVEFSGNVLYRTLYPEGYLRFVNVKTSVGEDLNADLTVERSNDSVTLKGDKILVGTAGFRTFILDIFPRQGELAFTVNSELDLPIPDNAIKLGGRFAYAGGTRLSVEGDLTAIPLNFIYRALTKADRFSPSLDRSLENVLWTTHCALTTDFQSFSFMAPGITVRDSQSSSNRLSFDVAATENELKISPWKGTWAGYALGGDVTFQWRNREGFALASAFSVDNEKYSINGQYIPGTGFLATGSYDLSLLVVPQPGGGQYLDVQVASLPVPIQGKTLFATLDWIGSLSPAGDIELVSRKTHVAGIPRLIPGMENASADIRFALHNNRLQVSELLFQDKISSLAGNGSLDLELSPEPRASGWLYLADDSRVENYTALINFTPVNGSLNVLFENSPLSHWGDLMVRGSASGQLSMHGPLADPVIDLSLALNNARVNQEPVALKADLTLSSAGVTLRSIEGAYSQNLKIISGSGEFDTRAGTLDLTAIVSAGNQKPVHAAVTFQAEIGGFRSSEPLTAILGKDLKGKLSVVNPEAAEGEVAQWDVRFFTDKEGFNVSGGPGEVLTGLVRRDGAFRFDLLSPFPLQGHFEGSVRNNMIEARADGLVVVLPAINELTNTPFFVIRDGTVRGDLKISGPLGDPDFFGVLTVDRLAATSLALAEPIGPIQSVLEVKEKKLVLREVETKVGNCPLSVLAEMVVDHWNIARFSARLVIADPLGAHLTLPVDIFAFDGYVTTPGLTLAGDYSGFSINGSLFVQKCNVILGKKQEAPRTEGPEANMIVDLAVKTGKQVELFWPAREFPILRMQSEPGAELAIKFNKLSGVFSLNGDINFKGGEVYYFERNFMIREGSLNLKENQLDFNPLLNLKAERKVRYNERDVKITMSIPNQRLKDFSPVFDSDPPLPITERYLALGGVIQNPAAGTSNEYLTSIVSDVGGDVLSQLVLLHPLEQKMKQLLNLDGFSIRTQFITNLLLDTLFNTDPNPAPSATINMGRYLNNTEISFQKYLDEKNNLFFETIVRIQTDTAPNGSTPSNQLFGNVNVESEFSLELTTPFFLTIKWSITPEHWESFFLPDNKITFKWGITF